MKTILFLILLVFSFFDTQSQNLFENLNSIVNQYSNDSLLNGSVLIASGDELLFQSSCGYKNFEEKDMNSLNTSFPIASLTKQFTSTAIFILQEDNKLTINDRISEYLEVPETMKNIRIKNLMNHTSGIQDYWQHNIPNQKDSIYKFLTQHNTLDFTPNTKQQYCNSGYFLLGEIIESASGNTYNDFLTENIFNPLGMKSTFVNDGKEFDRAIGYDEKWNINDYLMSTADGGLISTVQDLYLWDKALFENELLKVENSEQMFKPLILDSGEVINYGYGWDINEHNTNIVSHTGWLASFGAYNQIDSKTGYFLIFLSNQIRPELMDLIQDINMELYRMDK
jgi:CubicO group peptidase (beta-lactamase class C family)